MGVSPGGRPMDTAPFSTSTTSNWVARAGGLPDYVRGVAHALLRKGRAKDESQAISMAVGLMQDWASGRTPNGKGHVHPQVQAAAAAALAKWNAMKASAHAHANDGAAVELGSYVAPHVPAGGPTGGQFGTTSGTNSGGTAGKTPAQQHKLHQAHMAHLQRLVAQGKATPAQKAELARLTPKAPAKTVKAPKAVNAPKAPKVAKPKTAKKPAVKKPKVKATPGHPVVNKKKGTVTAVINGKQVTMRLHEWHVIHVAHQQAVARQKAMKAGVKFAGGDSDRFLEMAFTEALAERVPPGRREGGRFTAPPAQLSRHDTPEQAAKVINAMGAAERAVTRASTLPPPGFTWTDMDRLAIAVAT